MKSMWHSFAVAVIAGLVAEVSVQGSALTLTAYAWLPFALALCVFIITFASLRAFRKS